MELSRRAEAVVGSMTLAIDAKAKQMKEEGLDVIGFGAGEPDFDTPDFIKQAAKEALDKGMTKYTPAAGSLPFRKAICEKLQNENGLSYKPSQIVVSNGAKHSLFNIFQAILNPGDEVIIPAPYWVSYPEMVKMADGVPVFVTGKEKDDFKLSPESIESACTDKTKALILNSPGNPCGSLYTRKELEAIAGIAKEKDFLLISDEIYEKLIYDGNIFVSIATVSEDAKERTIVVNGLSKAFSMTGWRIGYTASTDRIAKLMGDYQSHSTSNPNSMAQHAGIVALQSGDAAYAGMAREFDERRKFMHHRINSIGGLSCNLPAGAFYIMMSISGLFGKSLGVKTINSSMEFADALLEEENVAVVPGMAFGADSFVRMSYATSIKNITEGLNRIEAFTKKLK